MHPFAGVPDGASEEGEAVWRERLLLSSHGLVAACAGHWSDLPTDRSTVRDALEFGANFVRAAI